MGRFLPQALPAELRRVRREPLLHAGDEQPRVRARPHGDRRERVRGHLVPGRPRHGGAGDPRRRRGAAEHLGLAVPRGQGSGTPAHARDARVGQPRRAVLREPGRRAGRSRVRRLEPRARREGRGARRGRAVRRGTDRRRPRPGRGVQPAAARSAASEGPRARQRLPDRAHRAAADRVRGTQARARRARPGARAPARRRGVRRARHRHARLRDQERLRHRRARTLGRTRLGAHGRGRRRCARPRSRGRRRDAVALHVGRLQGRRRSARARARPALLLGSDRRRVRELPARARARVQREGRRHHRGEPAGAHPRQLPDGALKQIRLARADDREQERAVGGLQHAVRRHGRRLRRDSRRVQDVRLRARALPQRARRGDPRGHADARAERRTARQPDRPGLAAALRSARSDPAALRRGRPLAEGDRRGRLRPRDRRARRAHGGPRRVQAPPESARREDHAARVRQGPPKAKRPPLAERPSSFRRVLAARTGSRCTPTRRTRRSSRRCRTSRCCRTRRS